MHPKEDYVFMYYHQHREQNHNTRTPSKSFEGVAKFRYLEIIDGEIY
jgi:hypothetical protein